MGAHWKNSPEAIKRMADVHRGIKQSEETQERKRLKLKGRRPSDITIQKAIEANHNRVQGEKEREKKRKAALGNKYALGKHCNLSEETKQKMKRSAILREQSKLTM